MQVELSAEQAARAEKLHKESIIYDATIFDTGFMKEEKYEIGAIREAGTTAANITFCGHQHNFARGIDSFNAHLDVIERNSDELSFVTSVDDIEKCKRESKLGIVAHFQDSWPIEDKVSYLETYRKLGLRVFQLTYNMQSLLGAGCCEPNDSGLTAFGAEVVAACNDLGILVDLSHVNHETTRGAIRASREPVAFTHVGVYALAHAYGRNKPDDLLKAVADTGGVVGIVWVPFLTKRDPDTHVVLPSTIDDVLDHMEYTIDLIGIDHVGIGTDLCNTSSRTYIVPPHSSIRLQRPLYPHVFGVGSSDYYDKNPVGLENHPIGMPNLVRGLVKRGYGDQDITKLLGGNWMRLSRQVWKD